MLSFNEAGNKAVPKEYRSITERLFSPESGSAVEFAKALGISIDYAKAIETVKNGTAPEELFVSFNNNMDLLIQKTWVEKTDETRKEALQYKIPVLMEKIKLGDYKKALEEFGAILEELAYLFFGSQSGKEDFTEYTFRLDDEVGLFWWYGSMLGSPKIPEWADSVEKNDLLAVLLLGICYLTNF